MKNDEGDSVAPSASAAFAAAGDRTMLAAIDMDEASRVVSSSTVGARARARRIRATIEFGQSARRRLELALLDLDLGLHLLEAERQGWDAAAEWERRGGAGRRETRAA